MDMMMMMMHMSFWKGTDVIFLFDKWSPQNQTTYIFGLVGVFVAGMFLQLLTHLQEHVKWKRWFDQVQKSLSCNDLAITHTLTVDVPLSFKLIQIVVHFLTVLLAYFIMLLIMTYNVGVFIAVVLGIFCGHLLTAFYKKDLRRDMKDLLSQNQCSMDKSCALYNARADQCCT